VQRKVLLRRRGNAVQSSPKELEAMIETWMQPGFSPTTTRRYRVRARSARPNNMLTLEK
jgi:hypothetical protein